MACGACKDKKPIDMTVTFSDFHHEGYNFRVRDDTNDRDVIRSVFQGEYAVDMSQYEVESCSLDIGAHIGAFSVYACKRYAGHRVLALEPLPENVSLIHQNAELNKALILAEMGAAGPELQETIPVAYNCEQDESGRVHHFIGNAMNVKHGDKKIEAKRWTLHQLIQRAKEALDSFKFWQLKLDCEGGEVPLIQEASMEDLKLIKFAIGESHSLGVEPLRTKFQEAGFKEHSAVTGHFCFENPKHFKDL